ncbi:unnamed protein product, partial [Symbiodinium sp. KB8]
MLQALRTHEPLTGLLPFAAMFYGQASRYVYYDEEGVGHEVLQGEGGEQGDPLMPGLYALGQHVHLGKTRAWNAAGEEPAGLLAALPQKEGDPPCWTGNWALPPQQQGLLVLGSPLGSREFVSSTLAAKRGQQDELLARLPALQELQSAWMLLLLCAAPRCNYLLRTVPPSLTEDFAASHDAAISRCLAVLLAGGEEPLDLPSLSERRAQLPLRMGGLGLSSAREHRQAAYWAPWADTVGALRKCHPGTLANLMRPFTDLALPGTPPSAREAEQAAQSLRLRGFQAPSWASLLDGTDGANPAGEEDSSL